MLDHILNIAIPGTIIQAHLSMEFSRQECWSDMVFFIRIFSGRNFEPSLTAITDSLCLNLEAQGSVHKCPVVLRPHQKANSPDKM